MRTGCWFVIALLSSAACLEPQFVPCGDLVCAPDRVCDHVHGGCIAPEQRVVCNELADGDICVYGAGEQGQCDRGVCITPVCGNQRLEGDEICDDGNGRDGDGCSAGCDSLESCGNGAVDRGEDCDDGGHLSHDGCSSRCSTEELVFRVETHGMPSFVGIDAAFDESSGQIVAIDDLVANSTWTWDPTTRAWTRHRTPGPDVAGREAMLVFHKSRGHVVLVMSAPDGAEVWEWDGAVWTQVATHGPPPGCGLNATYNPQSSAIVVLACKQVGATPETWVFKDTWQPLVNGDGLPVGAAIRARSKIALGYDALLGVIAVVDTTAGTAETWWWEGEDFLLTSAGTPNNFVALHSTARGLRLQTSTNALWNIASDLGWSNTGEVLPGAGIQILEDTSSAYRAWHIGSKDGAPFFAGANVAAGGDLLPDPIARPDKLLNHVVFDARRGELLVRPNGGPLLAWNGTWANAMSPTNSGPIAYDVHRDRSITLSPTHLWERENGTWRQIASIGANTIDAIVHDVARRRTILVGASTWAWDGTSMVLLGDSPAPPSQVSAERPQRRAVYDAARGTVVLFNGTGVWELVNDAWVPSFGPPASTQYHVHYDPNRRALWFVDHPPAPPGTTAPVESSSIAAWELRDNAWTRREIAALANLGGTTMYDPLRARLIGFGAAPHGEVWSLQLAAPGEADDNCRAATDDDGDGLAGCADPDCWPYCTPSCPPGTTCPAGEPGCGDATCDPLETAALCPADC